jgi:hypothetical protein
VLLEDFLPRCLKLLANSAGPFDPTLELRHELNGVSSVHCYVDVRAGVKDSGVDRIRAICHEHHRHVGPVFG